MSSLGVCDVPRVCIDKAGVIYKIERKEGYLKKGTLPQRFNNPCSLVFRGQHGAVRGKRHFAYFKDAPTGFNACEMDVIGKLRAGISLKRGWTYL